MDHLVRGRAEVDRAALEVEQKLLAIDLAAQAIDDRLRLCAAHGLAGLAAQAQTNAPFLRELSLGALEFLSSRRDPRSIGRLLLPAPQIVRHDQRASGMIVTARRA